MRLRTCDDVAAHPEPEEPELYTEKADAGWDIASTAYLLCAILTFRALWSMWVLCLLFSAQCIHSPLPETRESTLRAWAGVSCELATR
jgi:hypothetical protein